MGDAAGMTHDAGDGMIYDVMTHVCGMTHDYKMIHDEATHEDDAAVEMFYNDNGISALSHSNNSNPTNRMGMVNKTLL